MPLWLPGMRITADRLNAMVGDWQPYTPDWYADNATTTLGAGTLDGRYKLYGRTCEFAIRLEWGSNTTTSVEAAYWEFSLPVAPSGVQGNTWQPVSCWLYDASAPARWSATGYVNATSQRVTAIVAHADGGYIDRGEMPSQTPVGTTLQPAGTTWATGDRLNIWGNYETV